MISGLQFSAFFHVIKPTYCAYSPPGLPKDKAGLKDAAASDELLKWIYENPACYFLLINLS